MNNKSLFRLLLPFTLLFPSFLLSQSSLKEVNEQIDFLLQNRSEYPVAFELDRSMSESVYYRSAYLFIHDELQYGLDSALIKGRLIQLTQDPAERIALLEGMISTDLTERGLQKAKIAQLNAVVKEAGIEGPDAESAVEFMPEWQLRSYQYELQKLLAQTPSLSEDVLLHFDKFFRYYLQQIELELVSRGVWLESTNNVNSELLQRHFELRYRLNQVAVEEAYQFIDQSPEVIETRAELARLTAEIREVEQQMGIKRNWRADTDGRTITRQLLTEKTVVERIRILEYGFQDLTYKYNLTLHYDDIIQLHIDKLGEQLAGEKTHLVFQKNHAVILQGLDTRGPPGETGAKSFLDNPFPSDPDRPSSSGNLKLDEFVTDDLVDKILKKEEKAFNKEVSRQRAKFKALNINEPKWQSIERSVVKIPSKSYIAKPFSHLRHNSTQYYRTLAKDPVQASKYKAHVEALLDGYQKTDLGPLDLIKDDLVLLADIDKSITEGIKARELRKATLGDHAEPWLDIEIETLKREQADVRAARNQPGLNPEVAQLAIRPPPDINNEQFQMALLERQKTDLQRIKAMYGAHAPASVGLKMAQIDNLVSVNKMGKALNNFQQFQQDAPALKYWENALEVLRADGAVTDVDFFLQELGNEGLFDAKEQEGRIKTQLDETVEFLRNAKNRASLPTELIDDATRARRTMSTTSKTATSLTNDRYLPPQDLKKVQGMARLKDPGGIWLSPRNIEIPIIFQTKQDWHYSLVEDGCDTGFIEWREDSENDTLLCLRDDENTPNSNHWLNTLKPW
jgi:hypothetical protein